MGSFIGVAESGDKVNERAKEEGCETYNAEGWGRYIDGMYMSSKKSIVTAQAVSASLSWSRPTYVESHLRLNSSPSR